MRIFAIADLHLSSLKPKPMNIFGDHWNGHPENVAENWRRVVGEGDVVLVAGDTSWAMTLDEAMPDLDWIDRLPGMKYLIRGNHDYWWQGIGKLRERAPASIRFVHNDVHAVGEYRVVGARGWDLPGRGWSEKPENDEKLYQRERGRLRGALASAQGDGPILAMIHYPPLYGADEPGFHDILREYGVRTAVFGHLHGPDGAMAFQGELDGVRYVFCACDGVGFTPVHIAG